MTDQRERIHEYVTANPGVHFNALTRALDLASGQVQYHLRRLADSNRVVSESLYGRTHYFPPEYDDRERREIAVLRRETARDVVLVLLDDGPTDPRSVAARLDVARSTLAYHVDHLVEQDLVEKRRDERNRVTLAASRPEETLDLLAQVDPSLSDRMLDRFTRLLDNLLYD